MPIVSHTLQSTVQANGAISYVLRMYDQDATEYTQAGFAPAGFDLQALVNLKIAQTDDALAEQEFNQLVGV
jgi:hypothetical protein